MFTNISATVIFGARVEMHFHDKYKAISEALIGTQESGHREYERRMFRAIANER